MKIIFIISQGGFYVESQVLAFCPPSLSLSLSLSHTHTHNAHKHIHKHTHTQEHKHTHKHTYTHTHTYTNGPYISALLFNTAKNPNGMKRYCKNNTVMNSTFCFQIQSWNLALTKSVSTKNLIFSNLIFFQMRCLQFLLYRTAESISFIMTMNTSVWKWEF